VFYLYGPHNLFTSVVIRNATLLFSFCVCETIQACLGLPSPCDRQGCAFTKAYAF